MLFQFSEKYNDSCSSCCYYIITDCFRHAILKFNQTFFETDCYCCLIGLFKLKFVEQVWNAAHLLGDWWGAIKWSWINNNDNKTTQERVVMVMVMVLNIAAYNYTHRQRNAHKYRYIKFTIINLLSFFLHQKTFNLF